MKNKIKNTFKKAGIATIAFATGLVVFLGGLSVYANWMTQKEPGNEITSQDWNQMANQVKSWVRMNESAEDSNVYLGTSGNVGIGTTNPTAKLEVNGNIITSNPTANNHVATKEYVDAQVVAAGGGGGSCDGTPLYIKYTLTKYNGNLGGIAGANEKCNIEYPGYVMCDSNVLNQKSFEGCLPIHQYYINGVGNYLKGWHNQGGSPSCNNWTAQNTSYKGSLLYQGWGEQMAWVTETSQDCDDNHYIACCK